MDNTVMIVYKIAVYVMQLLHIKITDNISCRPLLWLTNDVINGADKHALSSLLLRLSHLGRNFKSCLLSTPDVKKKRSSGAKKTPFRFPLVLGKKVVLVLKTVTALVLGIANLSLLTHSLLHLTGCDCSMGDYHIISHLGYDVIACETTGSFHAKQHLTSRCH